MIERLRRGEVQFRRWRWLFAILGATKIAVWLWLLVNVVGFADEPEDANLLLMAYLMPVCYIFLALSSVGFGSVLMRWRGDAKTQLLLRITDELQRRDA